MVGLRSGLGQNAWVLPRVPESDEPPRRQAAQAGVLPLWKKLVPRGGKLDDCTVVVAFLEPDGGGGGGA